MYGQLANKKRSDAGKVEVLNVQLVGALLRKMPKITHPAKSWGDPALDAQYGDKLEQYQKQYPLPVLLAWIMQHPDSCAETYSAKLAMKWNESHAVVADVSSSGTPMLQFAKQEKTEPIKVVHGAVMVGSPLEVLNHQLAALMVALNPQIPDATDSPYKYCPGPCDPHGQIGCSTVVIPNVSVVKDKATGQPTPETKDGGPLFRAYTTNTGGTEGLVARLEMALNKPVEKNQTSALMHKDVCNLIHLQIQEAKQLQMPFPAWFDPVVQRQGKDGTTYILQYLKSIPEKIFKDFDQYYAAHAYMSTTCGLSKRAGYVYDGHFFCDLPAGMASKIHLLDNLMNAVNLSGCNGLNTQSLVPELKSIAALLPLNMACYAHHYKGKPVQPKTDKFFFDPRFIPGLYTTPTKQKGIMTVRPFTYARPTRTKGATIYTPANPGKELDMLFANWPPQPGATTAYISIAHPSLWDNPQNFIYPLDLLNGLVFVIRSDYVNAKSPGHWSAMRYLERTARFMHSRAVYPYTRLSWPQLSGEQHSRVVLRKGEISASDVALAEIKAQFSDQNSPYSWEVDEATYLEVDFTPPQITAGAVAPPQPLPEPEVQDDSEGEGGDEDPPLQDGEGGEEEGGTDSDVNATPSNLADEDMAEVMGEFFG